MYNDMHVWDIMLHYDMTCYDIYDNEGFYDAQPPSHAMNDESMKSLHACYLGQYVKDVWSCVTWMIKMKSIVPSCILYVHLHRDTSPFMMSRDAYTMMMTTTIMLWHDPRWSLYLQTFIF